MAAWLAVFTPMGALVALVGVRSLQIAVGALALVGAVTLASLTWREQSAAAREEQEVAAERLRFPVCRVREVEPYDVGVDTESPQARAAAGRQEHVPYVARDCDESLRGALANAAKRGPSLVVLEGQAKVGKSRTLFQAAKQALPDAQLVAPRDAESLAALLEPDGPLELSPDGPVVLWLDDLEVFVRIGQGLDAGVMDRLAAWGRPVVVLATYGGKGQRRLEGTQLSEPISELLDRWARETRFSLSGDLSAQEQMAAHEAGYASEAVAQMASGIGEYMVAAPRLERKFTTALHEPGAKPCAEGVAVVWAAIDWQRAGMIKPLSEELLRELHGNYLSGREPDEQGFQRGLEWALEPLYASTALLRHAGGFLPYDHIVAFADGNLGREIHPRSWDRIMEVADRAESFHLGLVAYRRNDKGRAERAFRCAAKTPVEQTANSALFNLGVVLHERGDLDAAEAAYRRADERGDAEAAFNLSLVLEQRGDGEGAEAARRRADERGDSAAPFNLGVALERRGDLEEAEAAYSRADERGHAAAATNYGWLLQQRGDVEGAEAAYRRADERGDAEGSHNLGVVLERRGDLELAEGAYRRAEERGYSGAILNLGGLLERRGDLEGAEAAYRRADERGDAGAAFNLGQLLRQRGDVEGAEAAYRRAGSRGHAKALATLEWLRDGGSR